MTPDRDADVRARDAACTASVGIDWPNDTDGQAVLGTHLVSIEKTEPLHCTFIGGRYDGGTLALSGEAASEAADAVRPGARIVARFTSLGFSRRPAEDGE